jgi:hypothetical protein
VTGYPGEARFTRIVVSPTARELKRKTVGLDLTHALASGSGPHQLDIETQIAHGAISFVVFMSS